MLLVALLGCLPFGLGADETDGFAPEPGAIDTAVADTATVSIEDFRAASAEDGAAEALVATPAGTAIDVRHTLVERCETNWSGASVDMSGGTLAVAYDASTADTASEDCVWALSYRIANVPAGTWTVTAADAETTVTVAP